MHQSIPAAPSPSSPGLLRGICPPFQSWGWGICKFCAARGPGICQSQGHSWAFDTHAATGTDWCISHIFFRSAILRKLFGIRFSYKHCNFSHVCLLVKMASKTVTRSITVGLPWKFLNFDGVLQRLHSITQANSQVCFKWMSKCVI